MADETKKGSVEFWASVRSQVDAKKNGVAGTVIEHYVEREINSRVEKTIQAIDMLDDLEKQLRKLKPDQEQWDADGKLVSAFYSKAKLEERKKITDKSDRIEAALLDVFEKADFEKFKKLDLGKGSAREMSSREEGEAGAA
jgi:hypothetical protein